MEPLPLALPLALLGASPVVVVGPAQSGRSALLFRAALAGAISSPAAGVIVLTPRRLQRIPGGAASAKAAGTGVMERIQFLYLPTLQELLQSVAALHETVSGTLSLIVLDCLEEYLSSLRGWREASQLLGLLLDTANHFSQKLSLEPAGCRLIVSIKTTGTTATRLSTIQRYCPAQCWLHPDAAGSVGSAGQGAAKLVKVHLIQPGTKDQEWLLTFDASGDMRISPLLHTCEVNSSVSGNEKSTKTETHPFVLDTLTSGVDEKPSTSSC